MFFDSRLSWRWYAILAIVVAVSFGAACWMELQILSSFVNNHIALNIPVDFTEKSVPHLGLALSWYAGGTGLIVMLLCDLRRPFTGYYQPKRSVDAKK